MSGPELKIFLCAKFDFDDFFGQIEIWANK